MKKEQYKNLVKARAPKAKAFNNAVKAFTVGGLICVIAQFLFELIKKTGIPEDKSYSLTTMIMIFIGTTLTAFGIYDKIGNFAGAGSIVPVTGFANSVASTAIEFKKEGLITGTCTKMFVIAGPVIVYGVNTSMLIGILYFIWSYYG